MSVVFIDVKNHTNDNDNLFVDQSAKNQFDALSIQDKRHRYYVYEENKRDIFFTWWNAFKWASSNTNQDDKKNKRLYWNIDKKVAIEDHFMKETTVVNDTSKIICKRCHLILDHSYVENDINTTKLHLSSKQCSKKSKFNEFSQLTLTKI